jgi:alpha-tubulin suppressor-like RCC1 family protein
VIRLWLLLLFESQMMAIYSILGTPFRSTDSGENMNHKSQLLKPILIIMAITFAAVFFIITSQAATKPAQPMVAAAPHHTVGLKSDGRVVAVGTNYSGQLNVGSWTNIVQVAAGYRHTVGLRSDGRVVAVGLNDEGQLNVSSWTDIVQVAAGHDHTVGLKSDGRVVAVGYNYNGQCNVLDWNLTAADTKTKAIPCLPLLLLDD